MNEFNNKKAKPQLKRDNSTKICLHIIHDVWILADQSIILYEIFTYISVVEIIKIPTIYGYCNGFNKALSIVTSATSHQIYLLQSWYSG